MSKEDKKALLIGIPLIAVFLIYVVITSQKDNQQRYENCINNGGKAILQETGYFEGCIIGDDKQ
jgi:hypothetical protein